MKKTICFALILGMVLVGTCLWAGPPSAPSLWQRIATGATVLKNAAGTTIFSVDTTGNVLISGTAVLGPSITDTATERVVLEQTLTDSLGLNVVAYAITVQASSVTNPSASAIVREYRTVAGTPGLWRSNKIYAAAPTGSESPIQGCTVFADRVTWDPLGKGSGGAYQVMYLGETSGWGALTGQFD